MQPTKHHQPNEVDRQPRQRRCTEPPPYPNTHRTRSLHPYPQRLSIVLPASISEGQDDVVCKGIETHVRPTAEDAIILVGDGSASEPDADLGTANNTLPSDLFESQNESLVCHRRRCLQHRVH